MMVDALEEHRGLRERKKAATHRSLRMHALELFAAKGFSNVTVEDIAEAADVSPRTFFNYFPSKEATLFGTGPEAVDSLRRRLVAEPPSLGPLEALQAVLAGWVSQMASEAGELEREPCDILRLMREAAADPAFRAARAAEMATMERALAEGVAERLGTDKELDPYPALVASCAVGALKVVSFSWANLGGRVPVEDLVDAAFQSLAEGLNETCSLRRVVLEKGKTGK